MIARKTVPSAIVRELAANVERTIAGEVEYVCLAPRDVEATCACYRDAHHQGWHRCLCGAEWPVE